MKSALIGSLTLEVASPGPLGATDSFFKYIDISSIDRDTKSIIEASEVRVSDAPSRARQLVEADDVLVSTVRPNLNATARVMSWHNGAIASTGFCALRARRTHLDPTYLFYFTQSAPFVSYLTRIANGASYPAVSDDDIRNIEIPLPDLSEQKWVALRLHAADDLRRVRRHALQLCDEFIPAAFLEIFGDPQTNPKGWDRTTIDDVLEWSQYGTSQKSNEQKRGYPILGMANLANNGQIRLSPLAYVDLEPSEFKQLRLEPGDIIFNRTNSTELVGKTACWRESVDAVVASYLVRLRLKATCNPEYFAALLNTRHFKQLFQRRCKQAVGQSNISPTLLREFPICLPPLELQHKFAQLVDNHKFVRTTHAEALRQADHLFQTLLQEAFVQ